MRVYLCPEIECNWRRDVEERDDDGSVMTSYRMHFEREHGIPSPVLTTTEELGS